VPVTTARGGKTVTGRHTPPQGWSGHLSATNPGLSIWRAAEYAPMGGLLQPPKGTLHPPAIYCCPAPCMGDQGGIPALPLEGCAVNTCSSLPKQGYEPTTPQGLMAGAPLQPLQSQPLATRAYHVQSSLCCQSTIHTAPMPSHRLRNTACCIPNTVHGSLWQTVASVCPRGCPAIWAQSHNQAILNNWTSGLVLATCCCMAMVNPSVEFSQTDVTLSRSGVVFSSLQVAQACMARAYQPLPKLVPCMWFVLFGLWSSQPRTSAT
jgi:hypothetical protein